MAMYDMNNPSGATVPPQAGGAGVSARLLGPDLAEKYGDVLGTRPKRGGDFLRDFVVGMANGGDPTAADAMKMKVQESYANEYAASRKREQEDRDQALQTIQTMQKTLTELPAMSKHLRKPYLKKTAEALGLDADPFLADVADEPGFAEFVSDPDVQANIEKDPVSALTNWTSAFGNGQLALQTFNAYSKAMDARKARDKAVATESRQVESHRSRMESARLARAADFTQTETPEYTPGVGPLAPGALPKKLSIQRVPRPRVMSNIDAALANPAAASSGMAATASGTEYTVEE